MSSAYVMEISLNRPIIFTAEKACETAGWAARGAISCLLVAIHFIHSQNTQEIVVKFVSMKVPP